MMDEEILSWILLAWFDFVFLFSPIIVLLICLGCFIMTIPLPSSVFPICLTLYLFSYLTFPVLFGNMHTSEVMVNTYCYPYTIPVNEQLNQVVYLLRPSTVELPALL